MPKVAAGIPQPPRLGDEPWQGLHHREGDQLGVRDPREYPDRRRYAGQVFSRSSVRT